MRVEHMRLQKTVCVLLRSPCDRYNKSLTLGHNWTLKGKSGAIGMSAIDTLLQLSADDLSEKDGRLILSIQSPDFFLASLLDWQRDYQERILRDLILRYGANNRLKIPYGGVVLGLLSDSQYPWINFKFRK